MSSRRRLSESTTRVRKAVARLHCFRPGAAQDAAEIKRHVKNNLARYKVPRDVVFIDELPRNATGKLLRRVLTEMDVEG